LVSEEVKSKGHLTFSISLASYGQKRGSNSSDEDLTISIPDNSIFGKSNLIALRPMPIFAPNSNKLSGIPSWLNAFEKNYD
tara:strand:- start:597 stop:839 length:243 start_codon:yes stop_codon:yes gene_type:complete